VILAGLHVVLAPVVNQVWHPKCRVDNLDQRLRDEWLRQDVRGIRFMGSADDIRDLHRGDKYHRHVFDSDLSSDLGAEVEPALSIHLDVADDDVKRQGCGSFDR
jgi:hypothetical protein